MNELEYNTLNSGICSGGGTGALIEQPVVSERNPTVDLLAGPALVFGVGVMAIVGGKALFLEKGLENTPAGEIHEAEEGPPEILELPMPTPSGWMVARFEN
ncbi:MAG: hypothetical protein AAGD22_07645 [Verrucomicrobiota bacterium]